MKSINNIDNNILNWLLTGDASIQYQTHRDLLKSDKKTTQILQSAIEKTGWGEHYLMLQKEEGHWGDGYYNPKWTSSHYTLLELKNIGLPRKNKAVKIVLGKMFFEAVGNDGGINYSRYQKHSDVCITGMVLNFASYFKVKKNLLLDLIDYLLKLQYKDGGWNCNHHKGDKHSSFHTTISVLEGLLEFRLAKHDYRIDEIIKAEKKAVEFLLKHKLYQSHRTGATVDKKMLMLSYPSRWKYDILRALDYFQKAGIKYDKRMQPAIDVILSKQRKDGKWPVQHRHSGVQYFEMEKTGGPSRINTLRVLRVLNHFNLLELIDK